MKLNPKKVATQYGAIIDGHSVKFGWYDSGKAFIAKDGELLSYAEAWRKFVPKRAFFLWNNFLIDGTYYHKSLDGIVRYLIDKYCR